ncbi:MAG: energy-coupling factor ABC transporter ATP-binding protein [Spirochaetes bacterium]|nr:energy-coupling factor ABC transporter ATP-binding protein [Spirochaetota bacterium]
MKDFLKVKNLSFRYPGYQYVKEKDIFSDLSFSFKKGEITLFLAPPESGKTTLSRIITALVPRYTGGQLEGNVFLDETDITKERACNLVTKIGVVFQNPEEQILTAEVESEIGFAIEVLGHDYDFIKQKTDDVIEKIGIAYLKGMNPSQLSGGEKRKLLFASLLALDPEIWVLDETFEEIDAESRVSLFNLLKSLNKTVFILTSKFLDIYKKYCSRFFLYDGKELLERAGAPDSSFMAKALESGLYFELEKINGITCKARAKQLQEKKQDSEPIFLKAENLSFKYDNGSFAVNIKEFYLRSGEIVVLLGNNGSGKSTFAKILCGLLKPSAGEIMIENNGSLKESSQEDLNKNVSYFFQNPDFQLFLPTVGEELAFGLKQSGKSKAEIEKLAADTIELFRLENANMPPAIMSYGARKRIQAAIYYLLNKKIVIIDEADSGISFTDYALIIKNIRTLNPMPAIMIISHDIKLSIGFADRIVIMENGAFSEADCEKRVAELLEISLAPELRSGDE